MCFRQIAEVPALSPGAETVLAAWENVFGTEDAQRVKDIEKTTNHDVKAVEYWIKEQVDKVQDEAIRAELQHIKVASPNGGVRGRPDSLAVCVCRNLYILGAHPRCGDPPSHNAADLTLSPCPHRTSTT